ncbi:hypothetical protein MYOV065v1_p0020 [Vibrio phage PS15B.2]|nr:hypothetical protein MYOV065v1_p0020 [Vibrio phage PS15B.2]QZI90842.1 hypothetical protein MYOV066v1_p0064 [Vibrio phage PS15B.3]QZI90870.1 hypothetical protein MYOV064v1_p0020 [Vibrio phage PS15B.4]
MSDLTKGPWVACVSSSDDFDICTAIKDKGNGNCIVANEIDEDYESLLLALPDMYKMLERFLPYSTFDGDGNEVFHGGDFNWNEDDDPMIDELKQLLAKARGESCK